METISGGWNVSCLYHSVIYEVLFRSVHNLKLSQMKINWTNFFHTLNTQMKKDLLMKTNTLEPNRQDEKVSAGSTQADLLLQVCKQVKEQASEEGWKLTMLGPRASAKAIGILCQESC